MQYMQTHKFKSALIESCVDDVLGCHPDKHTAWKQWQHSEKVFVDSSLSTKHQKGGPSKQVQVWLGKVYDTVKQWVKLADDEVKTYIAFIKSILSQDYVDACRPIVRHWQSQTYGYYISPVERLCTWTRDLYLCQTPIKIL